VSLPTQPPNQPPAAPSKAGTATHPHKAYEDVLAVLAATLFVAFGVVLFRHAGLLTGGTPGLAFLLHYGTGWNFGWTLFAINLPFYALAWARMGALFSIKTVVSVGLLSVLVEWLPEWIEIGQLNTVFAAVAGGLLVGSGMLMLFRHQASLGGFGVLALYLQDKFGWRVGKTQMAFDFVIVIAAFGVVDAQRVGWSILGAVVMNLTLAINHRPGRYLAV
jgi:uncharacterized membrane-anchored protein YitT (DUF2179 family)